MCDICARHLDSRGNLSAVIYSNYLYVSSIQLQCRFAAKAAINCVRLHTVTTFHLVYAAKVNLQSSALINNRHQRY